MPSGEASKKLVPQPLPATALGVAGHCLTGPPLLTSRPMKRSSDGTPALLGLDCGGTSSVAIYRCGAVRRRWQAGPGNVSLLSDGQLVALLRSARRAHEGFPAPSAVAIGMAGASADVNRERIRRAAARVWPRTPCLATTDLETAFAAAELDGRVGGNDFSALVLALSGTGSVFYGQNARGQKVRVGGWGHIVGDKGSAYEIGLRALKATLHYRDRDGVVPPLGRRLLAHLLLNSPSEFPEWALHATKSEIAALAKVVSSAAKDGDRTARDILEGAAHSIARDALACAARLARKSERVKFVLNGSVLLKQPAFQRRVRKLILGARPGSVVIPLRHEAALGAVELAGRLLAKATSPRSEAPVSRAGTLEPVPGAAHWTSALGMSSSTTEQRNPRSAHLDRMSVEQAINLMLSEDARIPAAVRAERAKIKRAIQFIVRSFKSGGRLIYVGAGTSGRLGVLDASECPPTFRSDPELVQGVIAGGQTALWRAAEGAEDDPVAGAEAMAARGVTKRDTVVGIAASGRTPFVWGALDEAKRRGAATVMVAMNSLLKIPRAHRPDVLIAPDIGPEILTGSTRLKSGTATKLILNMFTTLAMVRTGKVMGNLMIDLKPTNVKLRDRAVRMVKMLTGVDAAAALAALQRRNWVIKDAVAGLKRPGRRSR